MNSSKKHPADFSPYLDGDRADARFEEIRAHLATCAGCRDELNLWQSVDRAFRSPELEIDVSAAQWFRIRAKLHEPRPVPGWLERLSRLSRPRQFAVGFSFSLIMLLSVAVGIRQYRDAGRQGELTAIAQYGAVEEARLKAGGNPFRSPERNFSNPFTKYQSCPDSGQRKSIRRPVAGSELPAQGAVLHDL